MTAQKPLIGVAAVVLALSLSACGSEVSAEGAISDEARQEIVESLGMQPPEPSAPAEIPASEPAVYPGGVQAEIVSVEVTPAEPWVAEDKPGHDSWVRVTTRISTTGDDAYPVGDWGPQGALLYGPNLTKAQAWATVDQPDFGLVAPESPVEYAEEFSLPSSGLSELIYDFSPAAEFEDPMTFTDVEGLIRE